MLLNNKYDIILYMLGTLITSKTRLKLLMKFFVSSANKGHLRGLADEFDESTNSIRKELNQLAEAGYLNKEKAQNRVVYQANTQHPLFGSLQQLVRKYLGMDDLVEQVLDRAGDVDRVVLTGSYAQGLESDHIDVVVLGQDLDIDYLVGLSAKTADLLNKEVQLSFDQPAAGPQIVLYQRD